MNNFFEDTIHTEVNIEDKQIYSDLKNDIDQYAQKSSLDQLILVFDQLTRTHKKLNQNINPALVFGRVVIKGMNQVPNVIDVQFQKAEKLEYYTPSDIQVDIEDWVAVESRRDIEVGIARNPLMDIAEEDVVLPLKNIIRIADDKDIDKLNYNERDAESALVLCKNIVRE